MDAPEPTITGPDQVLVRVLAFPINPADLLTLQGIYPRVDASTAAIGNEAIGEVAEVGDAVTDLAPGDRVILLSLNNWRGFRLVSRREALKVSSKGDLLQQAGLKVNPATARLLLESFVSLKRGDWIIQTAANSAVGRAVIQIARGIGVRTVNVVRRTDVIDDLRSLGADVVLADGDDLADRASAATLGSPIVLGLDSVAGPVSDRLASSLGEAATLVVYGAMSGQQISIAPGTIVFKNLNNSCVLAYAVPGEGLARRDSCVVRRSRSQVRRRRAQNQH